MRIEDIKLEIRPRPSWEAADLGLRMVQTWPRQLFLPSFLLAIAICLVVTTFNATTAWSLFWIWLLKPILSSASLFVLSRAIFGAVPTLKVTLRNLWSFSGRITLAELSYRRLHPFRTLLLPARCLEGLKGKDLGKRLAILGRLHAIPAFFTMVAFLILEFFVIPLGILIFVGFFMEKLDFHIFTDELDSFLSHFSLLLLYSCTIAFLEPIFVASEFALYLNSRTLIEGWDLELKFRRLAKRITKLLPLLFLLLALHSQQLPAQAAQPSKEINAQSEIKEVLADPIFAHFEKKTIRTFPTDSHPEQQLPVSFSPIWSMIGSLIKVTILTLLSLLLLYLIFQGLTRKRRAKQRAKEPAQQSQLPQILRSDSDTEFPMDIAQRAQQLMAAGQAREAMSLLFRGALWKLSLHKKLAIPLFATEDECLKLVETQFPGEFAHFFSELTKRWQQLAYGHRNPDPDVFQALIQQWNHFLRALV